MFFLELCQPLQVHKPWDQGSVWNVLLAAEERLGVNGFKPKWGGKKCLIHFDQFLKDESTLAYIATFVCLFMYLCAKNTTTTMEQVLPLNGN